MNDQLVSYIISVLNDLLFAFRSNYSCQSLLLKCVEDWKDAVDNGHIVGALFMDLSLAFDCLPHSLLVAKLNAYGLTLSACNLIASYLFDRKQRVKINNVKSDWEGISKGVPQGSILGPLLFNIFVNDLFFFIEKCTLYNYADDNSMSVSSKSIDEVRSSLEHDGNIAVQWFEKNGMKANPDKFQMMVISSKSHDGIHISLGQNDIVSEECVKVLGVLIDNKLNFSNQISHLCKRSSHQVNQNF